MIHCGFSASDRGVTCVGGFVVGGFAGYRGRIGGRFGRRVPKPVSVGGRRGKGFGEWLRGSGRIVGIAGESRSIPLPLSVCRAERLNCQVREGSGKDLLAMAQWVVFWWGGICEGARAEGE